jgi:hypothetical protein
VEQPSFIDHMWDLREIGRRFPVSCRSRQAIEDCNDADSLTDCLRTVNNDLQFELVSPEDAARVKELIRLLLQKLVLEPSRGE